MKKSLCLKIVAMIAIAAISIFPNLVHADVINTTAVRVNKLTVDVPYINEEIVLRRSVVGDKTIVEILDLNGHKLMTLREYADAEQGISTRGCGQEQTIIIETDFYIKNQTIACRSRCVIYTECLSTGTQNHLRRIESASQVLVSSSAYYLENTDTAINGNTVQCVGVLTTNKSLALNFGISYSFLATWGFEMSGNLDQNWIARARYNTYVTVRG